MLLVGGIVEHDFSAFEDARVYDFRVFLPKARFDRGSTRDTGTYFPP